MGKGLAYRPFPWRHGFFCENMEFAAARQGLGCPSVVAPGLLWVLRACVFPQKEILMGF